MKLEEIIDAIENNKIVIWGSPSYQVIKDGDDQYLIKCTFNNHCIGLTWADGVTLNGKEEEFMLLSEYMS